MNTGNLKNITNSTIEIIKELKCIPKDKDTSKMTPVRVLIDEIGVSGNITFIFN
jgi:hypothetical protein